MTVLDDLRQFILVSGLVPDDHLFKGDEIGSLSDPVVAVYRAPGPAGDYVLEKTKPNLSHPRAQVVARSRDYDEAERLAEGLHDALSLSRVTANSSYYLLVRPMTDPYDVDPPDANDRYSVGFTVQLTRGN